MIIISNDHAGIDLKNSFVEYFEPKNINFVDFGAKVLEPNDSFVDYAKSAIEYFVSNCDTEKDVLLLICGSGVGMSIVANRNPQIRAVLCFNKIQAEQGRLHNNCNCLCLGERNTDFESAKEIFETFVSTNFLGGKYKDRIDKI